LTVEAHVNRLVIIQRISRKPVKLLERIVALENPIDFEIGHEHHVLMVALVIRILKGFGIRLESNIGLNLLGHL